MKLVSALRKIFHLHRSKKIKIDPDHGDFDSPLYEWRAPAWHPHQRGVFWLFCVILFFVGLFLYALESGSVSMAVAVIVLAAVYYLANQEPASFLTIKISRAGIKIGKRIYPYAKIKDFWLIYEPPVVKELHLSLTSGAPRVITVLLAEADQELISHLLSHYVNEREGKQESLTDIFARAFKL